jgi:hypothetical protein
MIISNSVINWTSVHHQRAFKPKEFIMVVKKTSPIRIDMFPTHHLLHWDEIVAWWLWNNFAHPDFKVKSGAPITFHNASRTTLDGGRATIEWIRKHKQMPIGIWGSPFDEHRRPEESDEEYEARLAKQECASSLSAKMLEVDQKEELQSILRFSRRVDNTATADPRDVSTLIKRLHDNRETRRGLVKKWVRDPAKFARIMKLLDRQLTLGEMILWVEDAIWAKCCEVPQTDDFTIDKIHELIRTQTPEQTTDNSYEADQWFQIGSEALELDQLLFESVTAEEYKNYKTVVPYRGKSRGGKVIDLKLVVVSSDDSRIGRYARSSMGDQAAVIVQRRVDGSYIIQSNRYHGIRMHDASRALKTEEALLRDLPLPRWDELRRELTHNVWHYFARGEALFNGAKTSPDIEPTKIGLPRIVELVKMALSVESFERTRSETCAQDICTSTLKNPCPWYKYGLGRCQTIRWETRRSAAVGK